jgi:hypothetical protein
MPLRSVSVDFEGVENDVRPHHPCTVGGRALDIRLTPSQSLKPVHILGSHRVRVVAGLKYKQ